MTDRDMPMDDAQSPDPSTNGHGHVIEQQIDRELHDSYLTYAMSTIMDRALPDVRDGMKPSQRRIMVAMNDLNLSPGRKHRKCAKIAEQLTDGLGDASVAGRVGAAGGDESGKAARTEHRLLARGVTGSDDRQRSTAKSLHLSIVTVPLHRRHHRCRSAGVHHCLLARGVAGSDDP